MGEMKLTVNEDGKSLVLEREFRAPRSKVWAAWTAPELFSQWWGPRGWSTVVKHMDVQPGGYLHYGMKCEDPEQEEWYGKYSWGISRFTAVDPEHSIEYTDEFCDENGVVTPGMPSMTNRLEFIENGDVTLLRSTGTYETAEALKQVLAMGMEQGVKETWDRLAEVVEKED